MQSNKLFGCYQNQIRPTIHFFSNWRKLFFIFSFLFIFLTVQLNGQEKEFENPLHPKFAETYCSSPQIIAKAIIKYEGYSKVFLEFDYLNSNKQLVINSLKSNYSETFQVVDNKIVINRIPSEKLYEIQVIDDCGNLSKVAVITTRDKDVENHGIEVSDKMFKAIEVFQKLENQVPFIKFLENLETVSPYEKIAFIQQDYLNGQSFLEDEGTKLPEVFLLNKGGEECRCEFVFNTTQFATPAVLIEGQGLYEHVHEESVNGDGGIKIPWSSDARYWWYRNTLGPGKWHYAWSEGWQAGGNDYYYNYNVLSEGDDDELASPHMAQLAYNFFCTNNEQFTEECQCEKQLYVSWQYDSRVTAHANLSGSSWWDRSARAEVEDLALVTMNLNGETTALDAGSMALQAACSSSLNGEWFVELIDVALYAFLYYNNSQNGGDEEPGNDAAQTVIVNALADEIKDLIENPIYNYGSCETLEQDGTLAEQQDMSITLPANSPLRINLFSFSNQGVGGKRKWFSYSGIESGFYMAGVVNGGVLMNAETGEPGPEACCTDKLANWVYGSLNTSPEHEESMHTLASNAISLWQPWSGLVPNEEGLIKLPGQVGHLSDKVHCEDLPPGGEMSPKIIIGNNSTLNSIPLITKKEASIQENAPDVSDINTQPKNNLEMVYSEKIIIFDINGRILYQGQQAITPANFQQFLQENNLIQNTGLYFVHFIKNNGERETLKVFVSK